MHNGVGVKFGKPTKRKGSKFPIILVIIIILALLAGIYFVHGIFFNKDSNEPTQPVKAEQVQPTDNNAPVQPTVTQPDPVEPTEEINEEVTEDEEATVEDENSDDTEQPEEALPEEPAENPDSDLTAEVETETDTAEVAE